MVTTIQLDEHTKNLLNNLKRHHRESYNELLRRLIEVYQSGADRENLIETLEIMSDPSAMRDIAEGIEAYQAGKGKTLKKLRKELDV
ncbi:MAG TPA: antitoxin VapB family protein [Candidatus Nanoarchaeia archaeon]|nr:antitoxin VapB family protein [Candidatus Nanoarchaeia archaeon]